LFAREHFPGSRLATAAIIPAVSRELRHQLANVSIIGMPGCGKSTVGAALAKLRAMVAAQGGDGTTAEPYLHYFIIHPL